MTRVLVTHWEGWHRERIYKPADSIAAALAEIHHAAPIAWDAQALHFGLEDGDTFDPGEHRPPIAIDLDDIDIVVTVYKRVDTARWGVWKIGRIYVLAPEHERPDGVDRPTIGNAFDYYDPIDVPGKPLGEWRSIDPLDPRRGVVPWDARTEPVIA